MIELPDKRADGTLFPRPRSVRPVLIEHGGVIRSALGGESQRVARLGSRFRAAISWPPVHQRDAAMLVSKLLEAKVEGIRLPYPLLSQHQGISGAPVVDGNTARGYTLPVRGLTPGYVAKEGFWLSVVHDGRHHLHNVRETVTADANGKAVLRVHPGLRKSFADGSAIHLARPMIEGFIDGGEFGWELTVHHHHEGIEIVVEEF